MQLAPAHARRDLVLDDRAQVSRPRDVRVTPTITPNTARATITSTRALTSATKLRRFIEDLSRGFARDVLSAPGQFGNIDRRPARRL
jgi:hypothetical protein